MSRSLISLDGLTRGNLEELIDQGLKMAERIEGGSRFGDELMGRVVTTAFFEPSTRTRLSFEQAARFLGADVMSYNPATSSEAKGESLKDTAQTLAAIGTDVFVIRHTEEDAPNLVAQWTSTAVINGGAGRRDHPTQALLDALTITRHFGSPDGLQIGIVGDIRNSRVAASLLQSLPKLGGVVTMIAPPSLMPDPVPVGIGVTGDFDAAIGDLDVVCMLRVQRERGADLGPGGEDEYVRRYQLGSRRAAMMKPEAVVMHPGPINRGVEITDDVADGPRSLVRRQVANGVPTRMAVLAWAIGER